MPVLAVAALSARMMAEAAATDGFSVIALDLFGDQDTRRAAAQWLPIGDPAALRIDAPRVLSALHALAARGDVMGWVPGGGFEGLPELLAQGAAVLPLLGTAPPAVRRVREPDAFFGFLAAQRIAHPETQALPPTDSRGWLLKSALGSGGWHIRHAPQHGGTSVPAHHYFQRELAGTPMSATFLANGRDAVVLGFNELLVRRIGSRPYVYGGAIGPVPLPPATAAAVTATVRALAAEFALCGLGSLDFLRDPPDGERFTVLEVNPRPPATLWAHARGLAQGAMGAHVQACLQGVLPAQRPLPEPETLSAPDAVSGLDIVYARRPLVLGVAAVARLAARPDLHDLPWSATAFEAGDPVCSVSARGAHCAQVKARLQAARDDVLNELETTG
ncbi:ATP-grasp domain-containing protein [Aquabacterium sp.]|uniref:ATP-grasp domain-containing protein n=1 Tax=Aquabacterium sp. TaxID=1872578 RepID=UPI002B61CA36|nr:ATP-grasp domain-containing protein [Aquabacterium sp.]HSW08748.1 ATP-grasp domain-containing protein [Aquabacterium sp.]